jgi:hypothetical protein
MAACSPSSAIRSQTSSPPSCSSSATRCCARVRGSVHAADGATFQATDTIYFDWAWSSTEYATAWIGVARSPDGPWSPSPEKTLRDTSYGFPSDFLSSHAYIPASSIGPGTWYWQLCNRDIYAEDDKCVLAGDIRQITILQPAPPSAPYLWLAPPTGGDYGPPGATWDTNASFRFSYNGTFGDFASCAYRLDSGAWAPCRPPFITSNFAVDFTNLAPGSHTFAVHFTDKYGQTGADSTYTWTVTGPAAPPAPKPKPAQKCTAPNLKGMTLSKARSALSKAHCTLGRVSQPKHVKPHHPLRVTWQSVQAKSVKAQGTHVSVRLA